jgi:hypothetical protein
MMPPHPCSHEATIKEIHKAIYGNGKPEEGLIWKVTSNTEFISMLKRYFGIIIGIAIAGSMSAIGSFAIEVTKHLLKNGA